MTNPIRFIFTPKITDYQVMILQEYLKIRKEMFGSAQPMAFLVLTKKKNSETTFTMKDLKIYNFTKRLYLLIKMQHYTLVEITVLPFLTQIILEKKKRILQK